LNDAIKLSCTLYIHATQTSKVIIQKRQRITTKVWLKTFWCG